MVWRLQVATPANVSIAMYGPGQVDGDGGITSIDSFDLDGSGNCLSMQFRALPSRNAITPRSIVTLQLWDASINDWVNRWRGVVTTLGTARSDRVQAYEALGMKQMFYEAPLRSLPYWPLPQDASLDAADLPPFSVSQPLGSTPYAGVTRDANSTPFTGFQIGLKQTDFEHFGEFLDERAAQVGAFVVPYGETYFYDGRYFFDGDIVPAVKWGVDAEGYFFFRRPIEDTLVVDEADPDVAVDWLPISTEDKVTYADLVLFRGGPQPNVLTVLRRSERTGTGPFFREMTANRFGGLAIGPRADVYPDAFVPPIISKAIFVDNPLDYFTRLSRSFAANGNWDNLANATDGNLTTFANVQVAAEVPRAAGTSVDWSDASVIEITANYQQVVVLWYSSDAPLAVSTYGSVSSVLPGSTTTNTVEVVYEFPATNTDTEIIPRQVVIPLLSTAPFATTLLDFYSVVRILGVTGLRIYDCGVFEVDLEIRDRVFESILQPLREEAAVVDIRGFGPIVTNVEIEPGDGSANVLMPVERVEYRLSVDDGIATRYYAGQRYGAELQAQAAVINALVRRLTKTEDRL